MPCAARSRWDPRCIYPISRPLWFSPSRGAQAARSISSWQKYSILEADLQGLCTIGSFPRRNNTFCAPKQRTPAEAGVLSPPKSPAAPAPAGAKKDKAAFFAAPLANRCRVSRQVSRQMNRLRPEPEPVRSLSKKPAAFRRRSGERKSDHFRRRHVRRGNTFQAASVEFVRSRLQPFCQKSNTFLTVSEKAPAGAGACWGSVSAITRARVRAHSRRAGA